MAYQKFVPSVWAESINRELEKALVFAEDCNRQYEGNVQKMGDTVRILGVGQPTITTATFQAPAADSSLTRNSNITLAAPEEVADNDVVMLINNISYYNFMVGDIDQKQAVPGVMDALTKESAYGLADAMDQAIANEIKTNGTKLDTNATAVTKANILTYIDSAIQKLYEANVPRSTELVLTVNPAFYMLLKQAYVDLDTNNSAMLENGRVGKYGNVTVKMSNNITTTGFVGISLRTKKAVAFANPLTHVEPYRPEIKFADALKGFVLYGTKIVRPNELVVLNCTL